jgi:hypothetical protein
MYLGTGWARRSRLARPTVTITWWQRRRLRSPVGAFIGAWESPGLSCVLCRSVLFESWRRVIGLPDCDVLLIEHVWAVLIRFTIGISSLYRSRERTSRVIIHNHWVFRTSPGCQRRDMLWRVYVKT